MSSDFHWLFFIMVLAALFAASLPGMALDGFSPPGFWRRYEIILATTWQASIAASIAGAGVYELLKRLPPSPEEILSNLSDQLQKR